MIFLCFFRKISLYFDKVAREMRMIRIKYTLILSVISLLFGIISWIIGGGINRVILLYAFPRSAINIGFMFIFWGASFVFVGIILSGVLFGCEKYRRHSTNKIAICIILMQIFTLVIYPLFS